MLKKEAVFASVDFGQYRKSIIPTAAVIIYEICLSSYEKLFFCQDQAFFLKSLGMEDHQNLMNDGISREGGARVPWPNLIQVL